MTPLSQMDFRLHLSGVFAASDASSTGGGVTGSQGLSQVGTIAANQAVRGDVVDIQEVPTVLTVGLFDGIGGLRVAADAVGMAS